MKHFYPNEVQNLVGLASRINQIESLLCVGLDDEIRVVGIWGMGGIGKTTLAREVFKKISSHFEVCCFLENDRKKSSKAKLENKLLVAIFGEGSYNSRWMLRAHQLRNKKVLVVLDDVDDFDQIEFLESTCFGMGSRIIATSRDKNVFEDRVHGIYEVPALIDHEALQLFSIYAFKQIHPKGDHMELSSTVVSYAGGNPLALKILGSFLRGKNKGEWESALKKLKKVPHKKIQDVLKISYDGLDFEEQQTFLHVACFFKGEPLRHVERLLNACDIHAQIAIRVLNDKSLITISNSCVHIHDLLQEMGRDIVRQECMKEPGKRSRLWNHEDIYHVLTKNKGTKAVEGIFLDKSKLNTLYLAPTIFSKMNQIKYLKFHYSNVNVDNVWSCDELIKYVPNDVHFPEGLASLPEELRFLQWHFYPLKCLPSQFHTEKLVELNMSGSHVRSLWNGVQQNLANLKVIKLRHCRSLIEMPNLSGAKNLETLDCRGCTSLVEICPSIGCLQKLQSLELSYCRNITSLPSTKGLTSFETLILSYCSKIKRFPEIPESIETLRMKGTAIEEIPSSIGLLSRLKVLSLRDCKNLKILPNTFFQLGHLDNLSICGPYVNPLVLISKLASFSSLTKLSLQGSKFETLPSSIKLVLGLRELYLNYCTRLQSLPHLPLYLVVLNASYCTSLRAVSNSLMALTQDWGFFYFVNCGSLNQQEHRNILRLVRHRILHVAHVTIKQGQDVYSSDKFLAEQLTFILPGNKIPNWIQHQSEGDSITVPLPSDWYHNFLGFALSAVFKLGHTTNPRWMKLECQLNSNCGESYCISAKFDYWESDGFRPTEQLFVSYSNKFCINLEDKGGSVPCYNEALFKFLVVDEYGNSLASSLLKCGVQLLHDGDESSEDPSHNCSFDDDEVDKSSQVAHSTLFRKKRKKRKLQMKLVGKMKRKWLMNPVTCAATLRKKRKMMK
ncbi:disease resistance protein RPP2B-like isoform X4 [Hevea brasiliensis]|nr:disease resistance protein RPP2B-like isoform X4 [Hevea brasiliensis]XP_057984812.1 disease resistance protein RPP2B-like isoform X4 [Hevea brasiliensis]